MNDSLWGDLTEQERQEWFRHMDTWGPDLLDGYGKVCELIPVRSAKFQHLFGDWVT